MKKSLFNKKYIKLLTIITIITFSIIISSKILVNAYILVNNINPNFTANTLDGSIQKVTCDINNIKITTQTKKEACSGWYVTMMASPPTILSGTNAGKSLSPGCLAVSTPVVTNGDRPGTLNKQGGIINPDTNNGLVIIKEPKNNTKKASTFNVNFPSPSLTLTLYPYEAYAGVYTTTITTNIIQGP